MRNSSLMYITGNCPDEISMEGAAWAAAAVDAVHGQVVCIDGAYNYAGLLGVPSILIERGDSGRWSEEEGTCKCPGSA